MIAKGEVIYLKAPMEVLLKRTEKDKKRPLLAHGNRKQILKALKEERDPQYEEVANIIVNKSELKNRNTVIDEIIDKLSNK